MVETLNKIQRSFSKSAKSYDRFSSLHRQIADKLLADVLQGPKPTTLLDVGCGTGYLTGQLKGHFPDSQVVGLDFARDMLHLAGLKRRDIAWVWADGQQLPFSDGSFDILVSNLAYQWVGDLSQAFAQARRVLSDRGILVCTLFGCNTCHELFQSLDKAKPGALQFSRLADKARIQEALILSGFKNPVLKCEEIKIQFKDMQALIAWLKSIGANNLLRQGYVGKELLQEASVIYRQRFASAQGIEATFEVIWIYAKK